MPPTDPTTRLRELARAEARHLHSQAPERDSEGRAIGELHAFGYAAFDTCPHPDCLVVRDVPPLAVELQQDPLAGLRAAKYLNPVCAEDGCQWLRAIAGGVLSLHRCTVCGTRWLLWPAGFQGVNDAIWNLLDHQQRPGSCCDNVAMGEQIEHLRDIPLSLTASPAPLAVRPQGWQPIETALDDGDMLVADADGYVGEGWLDDGGKWFWADDTPIERPTHCMPLPDPPAASPASVEPETSKKDVV